MPSITEILTQNSNDKVEIKSQVNLNGQALKVFKTFSDEFKIEEQATIIKERNIGGLIGIYGNPAFGIYGTSTYGNTAVTGFVLGNLLAGVLGTNTLGETGASFETVRVIPPNRKFIERFIGTSFVNLSSTAVISGESANFSSGHYLQSNIIYKDEETISNVTINPVFSSGTGNLSSYISSDNGVTFTEVINGVSSVIGTPGESVIYKLVAIGNAKITKLEVII